MNRRIFKFLFALPLLLIGCQTQNASEEQHFIRSITKDLPFKIDSLSNPSSSDYTEFHFSNREYISAAPDIEITPEGKTVIYRTTALESLSHQYENIIWRNVVVSKRHKRVICIDRYLKDGRTNGYIYVFQTEMKKYPTYGTYHWDVSDSHHIEFMGSILSNLDKLAVKRLNIFNNSQMTPPASQMEYWQLIFHADSLYDDAQFEEAKRVYDLAFTHDKYILPCHLSSVAQKMMDINDKEKALNYLTHRVELEKDYYEEPSTCLFPLLKVTFAERQEKWNYDLPLKKQLEEIFERDQHDRNLWSQYVAQHPQDIERTEKLAQRAMRTDSLNLTAIGDILLRFGFPHKDHVGDFASQTTWLIFQHSDLDHQRQFLPQMEDAVVNGCISPAYLAALKDRIDVRDGRPQKYGTQIGPDGRLCPLLDASRVNEWRKEVGLPEIKLEK